MRRKFEQLRQNLAWFVDQRDNLVLVIDATEHEVPYTLKMLDGIEQVRESDVFLAFAHEASDANAYVDRVMADVRTQVQAVNGIREAESLSPWPELPFECRDLRTAPAERIKAMLRYVRARLPEGEHRVVLSLLPVVIENAEAYARVVGGLLPRQGLEPWMVGVRIIVRDEREQRFIIPHVERERIERVAIYEGLDFSPTGLARALREDAVDADVPEEERMMALVQLVTLDQAHLRLDETIERWGALFNYYKRSENVFMQALCLCSAAEALRQSGRPKEAKVRYQQGLAIAQDLSTLPVALTLLMGVGEVCLELQEWAEAEGYLDLADQVASKTFQASAKCDIMDRHGVALLAVGRTAEARAKWRAAADLSREVGHPTRCESALEHLVGLFERARLPEEAKAHRRELAEVRRARQTATAGTHRAGPSAPQGGPPGR